MALETPLNVPEPSFRAGNRVANTEKTKNNPRGEET
jgi:hypothetical protein